ncbi:MAG: hypothetical protein ABJA98_25790 [Acidobacteriota bacterium]
MLHEFITTNRTAIIGRCEEKAHARLVAAHSNVPLNQGVPIFIDQLVDELRRDTSTRNLAIMRVALRHGHDLFANGFTVSQVVHEYGDICQAVTELAVERNAQVSTDDFRRLNRCLDDAIAGAVTAFAHAQSAEHDTTRNGQFSELRSLVGTASTAFEMVQLGKVGVGGATGAVVSRSLEELRAFVERHDPPASAAAGAMAVSAADGATRTVNETPK